MGWLRDLKVRTPEGPLERSARELEAEINSVKRMMVSTFLFGVELRDHELGILDHSARVAIIAAKLGTRMGISEADSYVLQTAARVHEMGMLAISPELINRAGPLSDSEVEVVRGHAAIGAAMTLAMHNPRVALLVGTQYSDHITLRETLSPDNLLLAGILRVADVIAAMTWPRPYQLGLTCEYQVETLENGSGVRFHPEVALIGAALRDSELEALELAAI